MTYQQEIDIWCDLYLTFNDNNPRHMSNALESIELDNTHSEEKHISNMHQHNLQCLNHILSMGITKEQIIELVPHAKPILTELIQIHQRKGESLW